MEKVATQQPGLAGVLTIVDEPSSHGADELVDRARSGDFGAYEELYHRHAGRIHGLCLRMTADRQTAEDLTQEAFSRAWEKLATYRGTAGFAAWLKRLAINVVLSHRRSQLRRDAREQAVEEPMWHAATAGPRSTEALDLERAIQALPPRARAVFVLHDVEGYRHEEIAGFLDIAEGTSKTQLHRARRLLREALKS